MIFETALDKCISDCSVQGGSSGIGVFICGIVALISLGCIVKNLSQGAEVGKKFGSTIMIALLLFGIASGSGAFLLLTFGGVAVTGVDQERCIKECVVK